MPSVLLFPMKIASRLLLEMNLAERFEFCVRYKNHAFEQVYTNILTCKQIHTYNIYTYMIIYAYM